MATTLPTIDAYLATLSPENRTALEKVRRSIRTAVPKAVEGFSYGLPAFLWNGKAVAGFAAFAHHLSYFPMSGKIVALLAGELKDFETSKGGIRFTPEHALPATLIRKMVKARMAEIGDGKRPAVRPKAKKTNVRSHR